MMVHFKVAKLLSKAVALGEAGVKFCFHSQTMPWIKNQRNIDLWLADELMPC